MKILYNNKIMEGNDGFLSIVNKIYEEFIKSGNNSELNGQNIINIIKFSYPFTRFIVTETIKTITHNNEAFDDLIKTFIKVLGNTTNLKLHITNGKYDFTINELGPWKYVLISLNPMTTYIENINDDKSKNTIKLALWLSIKYIEHGGSAGEAFQFIVNCVESVDNEWYNISRYKKDKDNFMWHLRVRTYICLKIWKILNQSNYKNLSKTLKINNDINDNIFIKRKINTKPSWLIDISNNNIIFPEDENTLKFGKYINKRLYKTINLIENEDDISEIKENNNTIYVTNIYVNFQEND
jgi:hypothetical protein